MFDGGKMVAVGTPKELFSDAELIERAGLEVPVTCYLTNKLKGLCEIDSDFKADDFARKTAEKIRNQ